MTPANKEAYKQLLDYMDQEMLLNQHWEEMSMFETALIALRMVQKDFDETSNALVKANEEIDELRARLTEKGWTKIIDQNARITELRHEAETLREQLKLQIGKPDDHLLKDNQDLRESLISALRVSNQGLPPTAVSNFSCSFLFSLVRGPISSMK